MSNFKAYLGLLDDLREHRRGCLGVCDAEVELMARGDSLWGKLSPQQQGALQTISWRALPTEWRLDELPLEDPDEV